jgi:hypothetical protein
MHLTILARIDEHDTFHYSVTVTTIIYVMHTLFILCSMTLLIIISHGYCSYMFIFVCSRIYAIMQYQLTSIPRYPSSQVMRDAVYIYVLSVHDDLLATNNCYCRNAVPGQQVVIQYTFPPRPNGRMYLPLLLVNCHDFMNWLMLGMDYKLSGLAWPIPGKKRLTFVYSYR